MAFNSRIILAKDIKMDREHNNVLDYSETQMLTLLRSQSHLVVEKTNYNFVRQSKNKIDVDISYDTCLQSNYIGFQNPSYSNKWFFAFVIDVEFVNPATTRITFEVDDFSTWWDYWDQKACFVVREHVSDDSVGANTIPENVETGDYIINNMSPMFYNEMNLNMVIVIGLSRALSPLHDDTDRIYSGLYSGLYYVAFGPTNGPENATKFIRAMATNGYQEDIVSIFVLPQKLVKTTATYTIAIGDVSGIVLSDVDDSTNPISFGDNVSVTLNSTLNGYTPRNNKLKCFPFNYLLVSNNAGGTATYNYEDFLNNNPQFKVVGCFAQGGSIKMIPQNYKKYETATYNNASAMYGLNGAKYPTCAWLSDSYINWLSQNSVNLAFGFGSSAVQTIAGIGLLAAAPFTGGSTALLGGGMLLSGGISAGETMMKLHEQSFQPNQAHGNTNGGDIGYTGHMMSFDYFQMSIRSEYARSIDDYFDRVGYKVNRIKIPNQNTRPYWNYVQIGKEECCGYSNNESISVPPLAMENINNMFRKGITIWHNHSNLGNYSLNNH